MLGKMCVCYIWRILLRHEYNAGKILNAFASVSVQNASIMYKSLITVIQLISTELSVKYFT